MSEQSIAVLSRDFATITLPDSQHLVDAVSDDLGNVKEIEIDSDTMADMLRESVGRLATVEGKLSAECLATTKPLRDGADWVRSGYRPVLDALDAGIKLGKDKLTEWNRKVRIAAEQQRLAAEVKQRQEAQAAEAKAEEQRKEAGRLAAEAMMTAAPEKAAALIEQAQATADSAQQMAQHAANLANAPVVTPVVFAPVKGATKTWKGRVVNRMAIHHEIAKLMDAGKHAEAIELDELFDFNEAKLNAIARIQKNNLRVPGCVAYETESVRTGKVAV